MFTKLHYGMLRAWHIHGVIGWFLGALAWRTCGWDLRGLRHGCDNSEEKTLPITVRVLPKWGFLVQKPIKSTTAEHSTNVH
jgi:hypothetical protein